MEDMKQQKANHVLVVENIQTHYRTIEDETQVSFTVSCISLPRNVFPKLWGGMIYQKINHFLIVENIQTHYSTPPVA